MASSLGGSSANRSEPSQAANAFEVAYSTLAALRASNPEKLIDESGWHSGEASDFHHRITVSQYRFIESQSPPGRPASPTSTSSSMAVAAPKPSIAYSLTSHSSCGPPSLIQSSGSGSRVNSSSYLHTSRADSFLQPEVLEQDEDGVLLAPSTPSSGGRLSCSFSFLACEYRSDDLEEWDTHCQHHLHGHLPKEVHCPFECQWSTVASTGAEAWRLRFVHVARVHTHDEVERDVRPERSLIEHLWRNKLVDDAQKKELVRHGRITGEDIHTRSSGLQDRRRNRR